MNAKAHEQLVLDIFGRAVDEQPIPDGPHVAEDAELLACWSADLLRPSQNEQIAKHLAVCPYCRHELAEMIQSGMLETSATDEKSPDRPAPASSSEPWYRAPWVRMVVAASLLVTIGVLFWYSRSPSPESLLAQAERNLQAGHTLKALGTAERLLAGEVSAADRARAQELLEQAGYQAGSTALHAKDIDQLLDLEQRVARGAGESGLMVSLRLQAERGVLAALSLDECGSLLKYDYLPDGSLEGIKEFTPFNETTKRLMREFAEAVSQHPNSIPLRLNYGQFLLTYLEVEQAEEQFGAALDLDSRSAEAHLGSGLVAFETKRYDGALEHFQHLVDLAPDRVDGHINVAVCLERLGRPNEARSHWEQVLELSDDRELRQQIERHLENRL